MSSDPRIVAREAEAKAARERLTATLGALKARVSPPNVAHRAVEGAKDAVRTNPARIGAAAAVAALFLARKPLLRLIRRKPKTDR